MLIALVLVQRRIQPTSHLPLLHANLDVHHALEHHLRLRWLQRLPPAQPVTQLDFEQPSKGRRGREKLGRKGELHQLHCVFSFFFPRVALMAPFLFPSRGDSHLLPAACCTGLRHCCPTTYTPYAERILLTDLVGYFPGPCWASKLLWNGYDRSPNHGRVLRQPNGNAASDANPLHDGRTTHPVQQSLTAMAVSVGEPRLSAIHRLEGHRQPVYERFECYLHASPKRHPKPAEGGFCESQEAMESVSQKAAQP